MSWSKISPWITQLLHVNILLLLQPPSASFMQPYCSSSPAIFCLTLQMTVHYHTPIHVNYFVFRECLDTYFWFIKTDVVKCHATNRFIMSS